MNEKQRETAQINGKESFSLFVAHIRRIKKVEKENFSPDNFDRMPSFEYNE